jgi:hypothetical protein
MKKLIAKKDFSIDGEFFIKDEPVEIRNIDTIKKLLKGLFFKVVKIDLTGGILEVDSTSGVYFKNKPGTNIDKPAKAPKMKLVILHPICKLIFNDEEIILAKVPVTPAPNK